MNRLIKYIKLFLFTILFTAFLFAITVMSILNELYIVIRKAMTIDDHIY